MPSAVSRIVESLAGLRPCWRSVLIFQLWFAALSSVVFGPALAWVLNRLVRASGSTAVSNYELVGFFLSPPGILFLVAFSTVSVALAFLSNSGLVMIAGAARLGKTPRPLQILLRNLFRFRRLASVGAWMILGCIVLAVPAAVASWLIVQAQLGAVDINYYLATKPPEWVRAQWMVGGVIGLAVLLGGWVALRWSMAIQFALFSTFNPLDCLRQSWRMTRGRWVVLLRALAIWWGGLTLVSVLIGYGYTELSQVLVEAAGLNLVWVGLTVSLVSLGYLGGGLAYAVIGAGVNEFLLTNFFFNHVEPTVTRDAETDGPAANPRLEPLFHKVAWGAIGVAVVTFFGSFVGMLSSVRTDHRPLVTAHRGSSAAAPENSLSALRLAVGQGADFSEIDVQHTADGELVLMHDADFMRIAGVSHQLEKVTLRQAREFDISGAFKEDYEGERIGTLQEAIEIAKGRMKLNIELKYNRANPALASHVVQLVLDNDFADQCVITSLKLEPLLEIEERWPEIKTGLIVTAVVGDVTRIPVDFYSLNSAQATPAFINLVHKRGKEVHVWTINSVEQMHQMIEQGADNLITDVPDQVIQLIQERGELSAAERLALRLRNGLLYGY